MVMSQVYKGIGASSSLLQSAAFLTSFQAAKSAAQVRFQLTVQLQPGMQQLCTMTECMCFLPDLNSSHAYAVKYNTTPEQMLETTRRCFEPRKLTNYYFMQW